jgi:exodeoxyribonuclease VII small subunit
MGESAYGSIRISLIPSPGGRGAGGEGGHETEKLRVTRRMPRKNSSTTTDSIATFETDFERLAALVDKLEQGNVPLGEMLTLYEEAMTLSGKLKSTLDDAELRIEKLAAVHEEMDGSPSVATSANELNDSENSEDLF